MYYHLIPIHLVLIGLYLVARNRNDLKRTAIIQPVVTMVALTIAALSFFSQASDPNYTLWILVGMGLCFLADIFTIDMINAKILYAAIGVFVLAYLEYAIAFTRFNGFHWQDLIVAGVFFGLYLPDEALLERAGQFQDSRSDLWIGDALYGDPGDIHPVRIQLFPFFCCPGNRGVQHAVPWRC